jgi:two-component system, NtrC family, sensor kinase
LKDKSQNKDTNKFKKIVNKQLFWFLLISLSPLAVVTSLQYYVASNSQRTYVNNNLMSIANNKAKQLNNYIEERQKNAANIAQIPNIVDAIAQYQQASEKSGIDSIEYRQIDEKYRQFLTNNLEIFGYSDIFLISQSGNIVFSVKRDRIFDTNLYSNTHKNSQIAKTFDRAKTLMQVEISKFEYNKVTQEAAAYIAAPIFKNISNKDKLIIGVVVLKLNDREFNQVANERTGLGTTGKTIVGWAIENDQIVFTSPTRHEDKSTFQELVSTSKQNSPTSLERAIDGTKGIDINKDNNGKEAIAAWRYLPSLNGGIVVQMDTEEAFASLKTLRKIVIILGIVTLILVILAAITVAKSISKPIVELIDIVGEFAGGNLQLKAEISTQDEIGQLSQSFNSMAGQIKQSFTTIQEREQELATAKEQLEILLAQVQDEAKQLASQLVHSEKMSSLGQLVAGVAHEINNPISFIYGNIQPASEYMEDLIELVQLYQQHYPNPAMEIQDKIVASDLDFLIADLPKLLNSMTVGTTRIQEIVLSLRNFSRLDEAEMKAVDIHEGIDSTLLILSSRLKATSKHPEIIVIKQYANLPPIECYPGQLNQVFMNILANAIDALEENYAIAQNNHPHQKLLIQISSEITQEQKVIIRIRDNGVGIPEKVKKSLFDPFFTTKPPGKGTGLGLSISYKIITEKHQGELQCTSSPETGTEFAIALPYRKVGKGI